MVTDNIVDEAESIKIQGTNKSDHNTLCLALKIPHTNESTTITRWKLKKRRRMEILQRGTTEDRNRRPIKLQPDGKINKMHTGKNNRQNTNKNQQTKPGERNRDNNSPKKRSEGEKKSIQHCNKEKQNQTWKHESLGRNRKRTQREYKRPSQKNQQGRRNKITTFLERKKENNTQTEQQLIHHTKRKRPPHRRPSRGERTHSTVLRKPIPSKGRQTPVCRMD